jgi:N-dimethylarginine dimethylaminohydrolase
MLVTSPIGAATERSRPAQTEPINKETPLIVRVTDEHGITRELVQARPGDFQMLVTEGARTADERRMISSDELAEIAGKGYVLVVRQDSGVLIGCAQVLLASTDTVELDEDEAYCLGSFVVKEFQGNGDLQLLHRAEEKLARQSGKTHVTVTERPDCLASLIERLRAGFHVVDYCSFHDNGGWPAGVRLVMHKSLKTDGEPFVQDEHEERIVRGIASRTNAKEVAGVIGSVDEIAVEISRPPTTQAETADERAEHAAAEANRSTEIARSAQLLIDAGYIGIGWARNASGSAEGAFVCRRPGLPPTRTPGQINVLDEYSRMREVIVNYDSFVADITPEDAINDVASRNIGKVDAIAQLDEYRGFVAALEREGVRIVRNGAKGTNRRFACFTRDSAFMVGQTAFVAHMLRRQRQPESDAVSYLLRSSARVDLRERRGAYIEGGDVTLAGPNRVIVGIGQRTNDAGADALQAALPGFEIIRVRHDYLHLDVLLTIVGDGIALAYEPGLPADFLQWLEAERYELVACHPDEQQTLGCNVLAVNDRRIIAAAENVKTNAALAKHVEVITVEMRNILMDGGGPRCMACPVRREGGTHCLPGAGQQGR